MSYFADAYGSPRFPIAEEDKPGLRQAQLGAIHAIGDGRRSTDRSPGLDGTLQDREVFAV